MKNWKSCLTLLALSVTLAACQSEDEPRVYRVQVELQRVQDGKAVVKRATTEARLLEPFAVYRGRCDRVMELVFEKGLLKSQRVGEQIPMNINGKRWTADFSSGVDTGYRFHVVGRGRLDDDSVEGTWTWFDVGADGSERISYSATIMGTRER